MWSVIKATVYARRWSMLFWCLGLVAFIWLELGVYSSVSSQAAQLDQVLQKLPGTFRSLFGAQDLFSPVGYMNSHLYYLLVPLMFSFLTIGLGSSLIAREESEGTLELLLSRPISRGKLILAKALGGLFVSVIVGGVTALATAGIVKAINYPMPAKNVLFATLLSMLLALMFGSIAFCAAAFGRWGRGASLAIAALVGLGSYIISSLESSVHWLLWPAKLLPYHYYNTTDVLKGSYTWLVTAVFAGISLFLVIISWLAFRRRDLSGN